MKSSLQDCEAIIPFFYLKNQFKNFQKRKNLWLFAFFTLFILNFSANAQVSPATCGNITCTSNDVRIISAYISGFNNTAIDCGAAITPGPFDNAELHLIVSTNTPRIGVSISGFLKLDANDSIPLSQCFKDSVLKSTSLNNLTFNLGNALDGIACGADNFTLTNVFVSWGTGNTDFCTSTAPQCPATPSKCRFKPGETIPVTVKLDVDFNFMVGDCQDQTNLTVNLTPVITANIPVVRVDLDWNFGDNTQDGDTKDVNSSVNHTYASAGSYTITLILTDTLTASDGITDSVVTRTAVHTVMFTTCCTLPSDCSDDLYQCATRGSNSAIFDLTTSKCNGSNVSIAWFSDQGLTQPITDPTKVTATDGTIVYGDIANDCGDATATVTLHVNPKPTVVITNPAPVCSPATVDLTAAAVTNGSTSGLTLTYFADAGTTTTLNNPNAVTAGGTYYIVGTLLGTTGCADTEAVTVTINPKPTVMITNPTAVCSPATVDLTAPAVTAGSTTGLTFTYFTDAGATTMLSNPKAVTTGTYYIVGTLTTGCADTEKVSVIVNPQPPCTIMRTGSSATTATVGIPVNFCGPTASGTDVYSYAWSLTLNTASATFIGSHGTTDACVNVIPASIGSYTLNLIVTNTTTNCVSSTCTYKITATAIGPFTVYTQGFYGNSGGKACNGQNSYTISYNAVNAAGGSIRFGDPNSSKSFTLNLVDISNSKTSNIYKMLPGGTTPAVLKGSAAFKNCGVGIVTASFGQSCTWPSVPMTPSISNILLAQIMTLKFNLYYSGSSLGNLLLTGNVIKIAKPTSSCGSTYSTTGTTYTIPCSVFNVLKQMNGGATIGNLYILANQVLGGVVTTITPGDMNTAVNIINAGFDGGGEIIAVSSSTCISQSNQAISNTAEQREPAITNLSVSAYPNPFNDKVMFVIQSPVSGKAKLDIYDMLGQKLQTVFDGQVFGGMKHTIEFNVPMADRTNLIYIFRINDQQIVGKLINMNQ